MLLFTEHSSPTTTTQSDTVAADGRGPILTTETTTGKSTTNDAMSPTESSTAVTESSHDSTTTTAGETDLPTTAHRAITTVQKITVLETITTEISTTTYEMVTTRNAYPDKTTVPGIDKSTAMTDSSTESTTTSDSQTPEQDSPNSLSEIDRLNEAESPKTRAVYKSTSDKAATTRFGTGVTQAVTGIGVTSRVASHYIPNMTSIGDTTPPKTTGKRVGLTEALIHATSTAGKDTKADSSATTSHETASVRPREGPTDVAQLPISARRNGVTKNVFYICSKGRQLAGNALLLTVITLTVIFDIIIP